MFSVLQSGPSRNTSAQRPRRRYSRSAPPVFTYDARPKTTTTITYIYARRALFVGRLFMARAVSVRRTNPTAIKTENALRALRKLCFECARQRRRPNALNRFAKGSSTEFRIQVTSASDTLTTKTYNRKLAVIVVAVLRATISQRTDRTDLVNRAFVIAVREPNPNAHGTTIVTCCSVYVSRFQTTRENVFACDPPTENSARIQHDVSYV